MKSLMSPLRPQNGKFENNETYLREKEKNGGQVTFRSPEQREIFGEKARK